MKGGSHRAEQVAAALRQVLADALARELRDPRVGMVTITAIQVSGDLSQARILVTVPGDEDAKARALEGLASAAGFLRSRAARTLSTRTVPELRFELDRGLEHASRIDQILDSLRQEESD